MQLSRRSFLSLSAPLAGMIALGRLPASGGLKEARLTPYSQKIEKAILYDATRCIGCCSCQTACKRSHGLSSVKDGNNPTELSAETWTMIQVRQTNDNDEECQLFLKRQCMHCTEAACVEVCPSGALYHNQYGLVAYDRDKCIGCGYCAEYCPFQVPHLSGSKITGLQEMAKCDLCADRVSNGQQPACVEACPAGALIFGDRGELLAEANNRVTDLKTPNSRAYPQATLYGDGELGGLHVLYVLADSPEVYGLPKAPEFPVSVTLQKDIFRPLTWIVWGAVGAGLALNVLVARARQLRNKEEH